MLIDIGAECRDNAPGFLTYIIFSLSRSQGLPMKLIRRLHEATPGGKSTLTQRETRRGRGCQ